MSKRKNRICHCGKPASRYSYAGLCPEHQDEADAKERAEQRVEEEMKEATQEDAARWHGKLMDCKENLERVQEHLRISVAEKRMLAAALLWLRNHYEFPSKELKDQVIKRIDRVLMDHTPSLEGLDQFRAKYGRDT